MNSTSLTSNSSPLTKVSTYSLSLVRGLTLLSLSINSFKVSSGDAYLPYVLNLCIIDSNDIFDSLTFSSSGVKI